MPSRCSCSSQTLDEGLESAKIPYSYGFAIIALTVLVKVATFPLTQKQASPCNGNSAAGGLMSGRRGGQTPAGSGTPRSLPLT